MNNFPGFDTRAQDILHGKLWRAAYPASDIDFRYWPPNPEEVGIPEAAKVILYNHITPILDLKPYAF